MTHPRTSWNTKTPTTASTPAPIPDASAGIDDGPAIERQISEYKVLNAGDCSAAAQKQVREVAELLCCDEETCSLMLRYFRWNREKLMEGVLHA